MLQWEIRWSLKRKNHTWIWSHYHKYKVRIIARFQSDIGVDYNEIFSLVVRHTSKRVLLELVARHHLELEQLYEKSVFLHGDLEEDIHDSARIFPSSREIIACLEAKEVAL